MRKMILSLCVLAGLASSGFAWTWTEQSIGPFDYYHGSDGSSYSGQRIGNQYYINGFDGCGGFHYGYGSRIGNQFYWNGN